MPTFTISIPENPPEWCPVLITQLTQCLEAISNQMNDIDDKLCGKFDKLYSAVKSEICEVKKIATSAHSMAVANAAAIESLKKDLFNVNRKCNGLSAKNKRLTELQEAQDTYSRREKIKIIFLKNKKQNEVLYSFVIIREYNNTKIPTHN